jgi:hypothetical protein
MAEDRPYEKLMLHHGMPRNLMVRRLLVAEKWTFVVCLCLASQAPGADRGTLIVSESHPIDVAEIALEADVEESVVEATLTKLAEHGSLVEESKHGALRFANWLRYNPERKPSDSREAARERKRLQREREKEERDARKAAEKQAEEEGRAAQLVMDDDRSAPLRAIETDDAALTVQCPSCLVSPGQPCVTRNGAARSTVHAKRCRKVEVPAADAADAFFRSGRGGDAAAATGSAVDAPPADVEGWAPIVAELAGRIADFQAHIWIKPLELVGRQGRVLYVRAPDHVRTWVRDRYSPLIADAASQVLGETVAVELVDEYWRPTERAA